MRENLVSKAEHETLTEFQARVDRAKMNDDRAEDEQIWVETTPAICKYFCRQGLGKSGYFDYQGVKVCETGRGEEIRAGLLRQLGEIVHGDAKVNQISQTKPQAADQPRR